MTRAEKIYLMYSFIFGFLLFTGVNIFVLTNPYQYFIELKQVENGTVSDNLNPVKFEVEREVKGELVEKDLSNEDHVIVKKSENYRPPPFTSCEEVKKIDTEEKIVVFTFDADGRDLSVKQILQAFSDRDLKTTFFVEGRWTRQFPEQVKAIDEAGHEIFNHSNTHPRFTELTEEGIKKEFKDSDDTIYKITGKTTKPFFRPPYGERDDRVRKVACDTGYQTIVWSVDAWDWREYKGVTGKEVSDRVIGSLKPGNIILMHTGNTLTGNVIGSLLDTVISLGYKPVSYTEALEYQTE